MKCATFKPISGTMKWSDIKVNEAFLACSDTILTLTPAGATDLELTYVDADTAEGSSEFGLTEGWWDYATINNWGWDTNLDSTKCYTLQNVSSGLGFIVCASEEGATITIPSPLAD